MAPVCDSSTGGFEYLLDFAFVEAFTCTYANAAGFLVVGLLVYGAVSMSIYIRTGSTVIPVVLLILTGGAVMTQVAAVGSTVALIAFLSTGAGVIAYLYYAYSR